MKIAFTIVLTLLLINLNQLAQARQDADNGNANWINGVVKDIKKGSANSLVTVVFEWDKEFDFATRNDLMQGISPGDSIQVKIVNGWAESVSKLDKAIEVKKRKPGEPQWITGEVTEIDRDDKTSLVHVEMSKDLIIKVATQNTLIENINVGDNVVFKVVKGWAESVEKK